MLDSYEVREAVDWTDDFIDAFRARHGYDPVPYLPALFDPAALDAGVAGRFLYDYRKTVSDLIIENHFRTVRDLLNGRGVRLLAEAGHGGYARVDALKALGSADIPMGEFWNHERFWVVKEAASAAHIYGRRIVDAETLTGWRSWQDGPAEYKRRFDIALCAGLNHPTFHTFTHNPPAAGRPGFVYHAGEHFNVNTTWWEQAGPLIEYMSRCDYLLQQGLFVADVAFYYGDQAPNLVPARRIDPDIEPIYPDTDCLHCGQPKPIQTSSLDRGYDYDYVNSEVILDRMRVSGGRIVLPDGLSYALLVLPDRDDMPLAVLRKIGELVEAGATVVGRKPDRAPGLAGYPACDDEVRALADGIWGACDGAAVKERSYGKGRVVWGIPLNDILRDRGLGPDFRALDIPNADQHIDFIHRSTGRDDLYFVSNSAKATEAFDAIFRVGADRTPEFWYPDTGRIVPCRSFARVEGGCRLTLELPAYGSVFVVFRQTPTPSAYLSPEPLKAESQSGRHHRRTLDGPFPARMGRAGIRPLERPDRLDRIGGSGHQVFFRDGELCGGIRARRAAAPGGARLAPRPRSAAGSRGGDPQRPAPGHTLERAFSGGCFRLVEARPERPRGQGHQPLEQPPHGGPPGSGAKTVRAHQHGPQGAGPRPGRTVRAGDHPARRPPVGWRRGPRARIGALKCLGAAGGPAAAERKENRHD